MLLVVGLVGVVVVVAVVAVVASSLQGGLTAKVLLVSTVACVW